MDHSKDAPTGKVPKNANLKGGSRKGKPNKHTGLIREMIAEALDGVGGVDYLMDCATDPKTKSAFLGLIGKVMPVQVVGQDDGPIQVTRIELVPMNGRSSA